MTGRLDDEPRDLPPAEVQSALDDGVAAKVTHPPRAGVIDVKDPVPVTGQDEDDVARQVGTPDIEQTRLTLRHDIDKVLEGGAKAPVRELSDRRDVIAGAGGGGAVLQLTLGSPRRSAERARPGDDQQVGSGLDAVGPAHDDALVGRKALGLRVPLRRAREVRVSRVHPAGEDRVDEHPRHGEARRSARHR